MRIHALADVVGYSTVTMKPGYNMLAVNFQNVGETTEISIQDLFPGSKDGVYTAGAGAATADMIMVWDNNAGEYATFFLYKSARGNTTREYKWVNAASATVISDKTFASGDSFWYYSRSAVDFETTVAGQVSVAASQAVALKPGYNMIGNQFPANFNPNVFDADTWKTSGAVAGAGAASADMLMVWNAEAGEYATYFLYKSARGNTTREYRWVNAESATTPVDVGAEVMPVNKGAWYFHRGTGYTLNIASPIK